MVIKSKTPKSKMICIRCFKEIKKEDNYIQLFEFSNRQIIRENFVHKSCWELLMDSKSKVQEAWGVFKGLKKVAQEHGVLPEEEITIP